MYVVSHDVQVKGRGDKIEIIPIGDVHVGCVTCDEEYLRNLVRYIKEKENCYWIGLGDYCEFINVSDPRFRPENLAKWIKTTDLADLAGRQAKRFLDIVKPIAPKCLGLACGNHEEKILKKYERNIYATIVDGVLRDGQFDEGKSLTLGYTGWILLKVIRGQASRVFVIHVHHGAGGGSLPGGQLNRLARWMWTHHADLVIMGHCHHTTSHTEVIETINRRNGKLIRKKVKGVFISTLKHSTRERGPSVYSEVKQLLPKPVGHVKIIIKPDWDGDREISDEIEVII